jgi:hypothetical protein
MRQDFIELLMLSGVFAELPKKRLLDSSRLSACPSVRPQANTQHPLGDFIKCDIGESVEILSRTFEFNYSLTSITVTMHDYLRIFTITSRSTLLRMRKILEKKL